MYRQEKPNIIHSVNLFISVTRTHKQKALGTKQVQCTNNANSESIVMVNKLEKKLANGVRLLD